MCNNCLMNQCRFRINKYLEGIGGEREAIMKKNKLLSCPPTKILVFRIASRPKSITSQKINHLMWLLGRRKSIRGLRGLINKREENTEEESSLTHHRKNRRFKRWFKPKIVDGEEKGKLLRLRSHQKNRIAMVVTNKKRKLSKSRGNFLHGSKRKSK